ncbi:FecCD family ABC transporter permease [[Eubacterium] cellulosolvens]
MKSTVKRRLFFIVVLVILLFSILFSIFIGPEDIPFIEILKSLLNRLPGIDLDVPYKYEEIVIDVRLPIVLMALFVGAGLGLSGASLQGLFQNPLVDPYIIGISAGGAFGYILGSILVIDLDGMLARVIIITLSFVCSMATVILAYSISRTGSKTSITHLLLAGIALSAFLTALTQIMAYFFIDNPKVIIIALLGSCANSTWTDVGITALVISPCAFILLFYGRDLNAFSAGDEGAKRLGVSVETSKFVILGLATLMASVTVPFCGIIGFVGLIVPHIVRAFIGPDHRWLLPGAFFTGGVFLVICDLFSRTIVRPFQVPVGVITGIIGGLFFLYLLSIRRRWRQ